MHRPPPKLDGRSAAVIFEELTARLAGGVSGLRPAPPAEALMQIFARYAEIVIDKLDRVPERNFLAYLNLLGVTPVPAHPARVPLTFAATNTSATVSVPARTQVAAPPPEGESEPVVFETDRVLELTTAKLQQVFLLDPAGDVETELQDLAQKVAPEGKPIWAARKPSDHILYVAHRDLFPSAEMSRLRLRFDIRTDSPLVDIPRPIEWKNAPSEKGVTLKPVSDTTFGLIQSGEVVFEKVPPWPEQELRGLANRWLSCCLVNSDRGKQIRNQRVERIQVFVDVKRRAVPLEAALSSGLALDLSKDFLPFGARPIFGSTLYLASREAFGHPGARVVLNVKLTNPYGAADPSPIPTVYVDGHPRLVWEYWNGVSWTKLTETDSTKAFRVDGVVGFVVPSDILPVSANGVETYWVRTRLISGNYGEEASWDLVDAEQPLVGGRNRAPTLSPPSISSISVDYDLEIKADHPDQVITLNQKTYADVTARVTVGTGFELFGFPCGKLPALYLGFTAPAKAFFVNRSLTLYLHLVDIEKRPFSRSGAISDADNFIWQFWNSQDWQDLTTVDCTGAFSRSDLLSLIVPDAIDSRKDFAASLPLYWFRIVARKGVYSSLTRLRGVLPNTVMATHTVTLEKEPLGTSDGSPYQRFYAGRTPMLKAIDLQVREADLPSEEDRLSRELSRELLEISRDEAGHAREIWVRWREVADHSKSGPGDRDYAVDRQSGEIRFGDAIHGRIPGRGETVRLRRYQIGGGTRGNVVAGKIIQMRAAVPYVESVTNFVPATGGSDTEDVPSASERGSALVRHRGRAVTAEDYEDLAKLASPAVAFARCVPQRDLASDPDGVRFALRTLSLLVIPQTSHSRPEPDSLLLDQVRSYLDEHRDAAVELVVLGPEFVTVSVSVELSLAKVEQAGSVVSAVKEKLVQFLHPLRGGPRQQGWPLGDLPNRSVLYALCASVPGVHHVMSLRVQTSEEREGSLQAGNFLLCPGEQRVTVVSASVRNAQLRGQE